MLFGDPVEAGKHDGQDDAGVLLDQTHDVLVVPVVQSSLCNLGPNRQKQTECPHVKSRPEESTIICTFFKISSGPLKFPPLKPNCVTKS